MESNGLSFGNLSAFHLQIPEADLTDMLARIRCARWAPDFGNTDGAYGVQREWLQDLVAYWSEKFDWRDQERQINALPQFRVEIDGIPIHFIHVKGKGRSPKPIILSHGWPWTFWDWRKVIGPLTDPVAYGGKDEDSFDVIVPSLPGFGFSVPLNSTKVGARRIADLWQTLMTSVLGYTRYAAGGGDSQLPPWIFQWRLLGRPYGRNAGSMGAWLPGKRLWHTDCHGASNARHVRGFCVPGGYLD